MEANKPKYLILYVIGGIIIILFLLYLILSTLNKGNNCVSNNLQTIEGSLDIEEDSFNDNIIEENLIEENTFDNEDEIAIYEEISNPLVKNDDIHQKELDCFDRKNEFLEYLYKKHSIEKGIILRDKLKARENKTFKYLDNDERIFYSKILDKCIGSYRIIRYEPIYQNGSVIGFSEDNYFYIDDIINDKNLYVDSYFSASYDGQSYDELMDYMGEHNKSLRQWKQQIDEYSKE